jgi:hypothetical protein
LSIEEEEKDFYPTAKTVKLFTAVIYT